MTESNESNWIVDTAPNLTEKQKELLKSMEEDARERDAIPESERELITSEKFSFPIGLDDQGELFKPKPASEETKEND